MENVRGMVARSFYPGDVQKFIDEFLKKIKTPENVQNPVAGIVPHAGWMYSGRVASRVFYAFKEKRKDIATFILFGAVHHFGVKKCSIYPSGFWKTPLGNLEVDKGLGDLIYEKNKDIFEISAHGHEEEHSVEVQLPFIKSFFENSKILPIAVLPNKNAVQCGIEVARVLVENKKEDVVVIGTTDLTHYGAHYGFFPAGSGPSAFNWMKENDKRIIDLCLQGRRDEIIDEARKNNNACGAGAMAATVSFAFEIGKKNGVLLEYTTSEDEMPSEFFNMAVGYAGIIF